MKILRHKVYMFKRGDRFYTYGVPFNRNRVITIINVNNDCEGRIEYLYNNGLMDNSLPCNRPISQFYSALKEGTIIKTNKGRK